MARLFGGGVKTPAVSGRITKLVESVLEELGISPSDASMPSGDSLLWGVIKGSAEVYVRLVESHEESYVQVTAPVMVLPEDDSITGLYHRLLELNSAELSGAAFGVRGDRVVVCADRTTVGLDRAGLKDMVIRVGTFADHYTDLLLAEFGGKRHLEG